MEDRINEKTMDYKKLLELCRICMRRDVKMFKMFDIIKPGVVDQIEYCTGLQISPNDRLPSRICDRCVKDLAIAYKFKTTCLNTDDSLRKLIANKYSNTMIEVKIEVLHEFNNYDDNFNESCEVDVKKEIKNEHKEMIDKVSTKPINISLDDKKFQTRKTVRPKSKGVLTSRSTIKQKKLHCVLCVLDFRSKEELLSHRKEKHRQSGGMCEICGKSFKHRPSLYTHVRSHAPPQYACDMCAYRTGNKSDLIKHIRVHTGIKLYQCEFCTSSFSNSSNLLNHIRRSHERIKRHACDVCGKQFFDRCEMKRHADMHNDIKRHECEVCHTCFSRRRHWKRHLLRQHSIEVPRLPPGRKKVIMLLPQYETADADPCYPKNEDSLKSVAHK